jgi:hypothetical protein
MEFGGPGRHRDLELRTFLQGTMTWASEASEFVSIKDNPD